MDKIDQNGQAYAIYVHSLDAQHKRGEIDTASVEDLAALVRRADELLDMAENQGYDSFAKTEYISHKRIQHIVELRQKLIHEMLYRIDTQMHALEYHLNAFTPAFDQIQHGFAVLGDLDLRQNTRALEAGGVVDEPNNENDLAFEALKKERENKAYKNAVEQNNETYLEDLIKRIVSLHDASIQNENTVKTKRCAYLRDYVVEAEGKLRVICEKEGKRPPFWFSSSLYMSKKVPPIAEGVIDHYEWIRSCLQKHNDKYAALLDHIKEHKATLEDKLAQKEENKKENAPKRYQTQYSKPDLSVGHEPLVRGQKKKKRKVKENAPKRNQTQYSKPDLSVGHEPLVREQKKKKQKRKVKERRKEAEVQEENVAIDDGNFPTADNAYMDMSDEEFRYEDFSYQDFSHEEHAPDTFDASEVDTLSAFEPEPEPEPTLESAPVESGAVYSPFSSTFGNVAGMTASYYNGYNAYNYTVDFSGQMSAAVVYDEILPPVSRRIEAEEEAQPAPQPGEEENVHSEPEKELTDEDSVQPDWSEVREAELNNDDPDEPGAGGAAVHIMNAPVSPVPAPTVEEEEQFSVEQHIVITELEDIKSRDQFINRLIECYDYNSQPEYTRKLCEDMERGDSILLLPYMKKDIAQLKAYYNNYGKSDWFSNVLRETGIYSEQDKLPDKFIEDLQEQETEIAARERYIERVKDGTIDPSQTEPIFSMNDYDYYVRQHDLIDKMDVRIRAALESGDYKQIKALNQRLSYIRGKGEEYIYALRIRIEQYEEDPEQREFVERQCDALRYHEYWHEILVEQENRLDEVQEEHERAYREKEEKLKEEIARLTKELGNYLNNDQYKTAVRNKNVELLDYVVRYIPVLREKYEEIAHLAMSMTETPEEAQAVEEDKKDKMKMLEKLENEINKKRQAIENPDLLQRWKRKVWDYLDRQSKEPPEHKSAPENGTEPTEPSVSPVSNGSVPESHSAYVPPQSQNHGGQNGHQNGAGLNGAGQLEESFNSETTNNYGDEEAVAVDFEPNPPEAVDIVFK